MMAALDSALATMWKTASTVMGEVFLSRAARAARAAGEPELVLPWSDCMASMKLSGAWAVSVPQSKCSSGEPLAVAKRPREARRKCARMSAESCRLGDVECVKLLQEKLGFSAEDRFSGVLAG